MSVFNVVVRMPTNESDGQSDDLLAINRAMNQASDYWAPERSDIFTSTDSARSSGALVCASHLLCRNTPQSASERVHKSAGGRYICVANARLDNRAELAAALNLELSNDIADGQLLLAAYLRWQSGCCEHLLGDFVFVVVDCVSGAVFVGRDHLGIKTVFYSKADGLLLISNEHNALLKSEQVPRELSIDHVVSSFIRLRFARYRSPFEHIQTLPAAHYLTAVDGQLATCRYWQLAVKPLPDLHSDDDYLRVLREKFELAVKRRLVSDYPIGCELSEGLDSTAISGLTAKLLPNQTIYTYSYDSELLTDETRPIYADTYQDIFDFLALHPNLQAEWTTEPMPANYSRFIEACFGAPPPNSGQQPRRYFLARDRGVRTLLSGWGGDHCVTSYGTFYEDELFQQYRYIDLWKYLHAMKRRGRNINPLASVLKLAAKYWCRPLFDRVEQRRNALVRLLLCYADQSLLLPRWLTPEIRDDVHAFAYGYSSTGVRERDHRELFEVGIEHRVSGSEFHARAFNLDYRYPMFDKELIEYAYSVPTHLKCKFGIERWMFREIIGDLVTERIRMRLKSDVELPRNNLKESMHQQAQQELDWLQANAETPLVRNFLNVERGPLVLLDAKDLLQRRGVVQVMRLSEMLARGDITLPDQLQ